MTFVSSDNLRAHAWSNECSSTKCPGYEVLQSLMIGHCHLPEVYEALGALLLGKKTSLRAKENVRHFSFPMGCLIISGLLLLYLSGFHL